MALDAVGPDITPRIKNMACDGIQGRTRGGGYD